ncbi:exopolysaccharide biosynthesis protein [Vibrio porteresiae]|uniref:Exopolysaccharide biosynthesis protein n=1 Tax=Vibrio porteresiae DSM 19223 TaxID=1123496 RepID=A0ABZ0QIC2_9VIBR|nr:exopolysaccharide biosynthesis protein [Vibrio porteresiae]WPC76174.1 exopolysaccharide biosynthesis protein [Vibrio porteresiae DSM 19223]
MTDPFHPIGGYVEKTSYFLIRILKEFPESEISIGSLLELLKRRSYGALLILLSLIGLIPGISFLAGFAIFWLGLQMALGFTAPRLPAFARKRHLDQQKTLHFIEELQPWLQRLEKYVKPRWEPLCSSMVRRVIGGLICVLAVVAVLPLPFVNFAPNFAVICLSLGIIEKDGVCILAGAAMSAIAIWIGYLLVRVAFHSLMLVL